VSIVESRSRAEVLTTLVRNGLDSAVDRRPERALRVFDEVLQRFPPIAVCYRPDEDALDALIAAIAVAGALLKGNKGAEHMPQARDLLARALKLRLQMLAR
jgi:hypothetical protein